MSKQPLIDQLDQAIGRMLAEPAALPPTVDPEVLELLRIARELRELPARDFKANLKADLERKANVLSAKKVAAPPALHTLTPYLHPQGLGYIDFLKRVFGGEETLRAEAGPGRWHAEVRIGDSMLMMGVGSGYEMPAALEIYVPNVDDVYKNAIDAGCVELQPVEDAHWEPIRLGCVKDSAGNIWSIASHRGESYIPPGRRTVSTGFVVKNAARFVDFLKQAFDAEEVKRFEWPGGLYVAVRIGDSVAGVSEAANHSWMQPMTTMINMLVPDCDTQYARALRAGAKSLSPMADQPYGVRSGGVEDAWGNQWVIATPL